MYPVYRWITLFAIFLAACSSNGAAPSPVMIFTSPVIPDAQTTPTNPVMNTKTPPIDSSTPDPAAAQMVEKAREHMAKKFAISVDQITVFSVQAMVWPDAGLGCPQQGVNYAQVETPGYLILLEAAGQTYNYHTDTAGTISLCNTNSPGEIFLPPSP
jgi:hypothetical protein